MRLTHFCDYSLRVLMYLGTKKEKSSIAEISRAFDLPANHLMKVVHKLSRLGYIESFRGKGGGIKLAKNPAKISLGKVVEQIEPDFNLVECFNSDKNTCCITPICQLKGILFEAKKAFLQCLNRYSLADIIKNKEILTKFVSIKQ